MPSPANQTQNGSAKVDRRQKFLNVWPRIRDELVQDLTTRGLPESVVNWYKNNLDYNVPGGKLNRGISVCDSLEILKGRTLTDEEYLKSAVAGWCIELLQAFFLVSDDLMDSSITRRGQPCWYKLKDVELIAVNDAFMLEGALYRLLKKYFRHDSYYVDLLELFHDMSFATEIGQLIDLTTASGEKADIKKFSIQQNRLIIVYKTAYYSFYLPVAAAMIIAGFPRSTAEWDDGSPSDPYKIALDILLPLGEYFQIQDDFLDYSGTPEQIGKIGTDIVDNKCSWCVCTALNHVNDQQRQVLYDNYGKHDAAAEGTVKELYAELDIKGKYEAYEEDVYKKLMSLIEAIPESKGSEDKPVLKREIFVAFLKKIYKRTK